jgi:hypothetical protein
MVLHEKPSSLLENVTQALDDRLEFLGFGVAAIEKQTIDQLEASLERINHCINDPESFKVLGVKRDSQMGLNIDHAGLAISFSSVFLPILLDRKKLILERIELLQVNEKVRVLHNSVRKLTDEESQSELTVEIDELHAVLQKWREQFNQLAQDQEKLREQRDLDRLTILEKQSKIWLSFLERESVATVVGALLLIIIPLTQIVIMLLGRQVPDILSNSFLVLLGYFFGQSTKVEPR